MENNDMIWFYVLKMTVNGLDEYHLKGFNSEEEALTYKEKADKHFKDVSAGSKIIKRKKTSMYKGWLF